MKKQKFYDPYHPNWDKFGQAIAIGLAFALPISTAITSICVGLIALVWLLGAHKTEKMAIFLHHPLVVWLYPLILLSLIASTYSLGEASVLKRNLADVMRLALIPILIYFYRPQNIAMKALWAFTAAMILTLVLAYMKVYGGLPIGLKYTTGAVFKSHIKTSFFMAISAYFLAFQLPRVAPKYRLPIVMAIALMIYYLFFMSVGRIGYITLIFCLMTLAWQWARLKGIVTGFILACMLVGTAYYASPLFQNRVNLLAQDLDFYHQGGRLLESSLGSRIAFADTSYALIQQKPLMGWGLGSYGEAYKQQHQHEQTLLTDNPHNEYLRISVELGLFGLLALLALFYRQWRLTEHLPLDVKGFCQGMLLTFMLGCFLNSWLRDSAEGNFFCLMSAICYASCPIPRQERMLKAIAH